jgi:hypothetical protein
VINKHSQNYLARYPEVFAIAKPLIGEVVMISSPCNYALTVENGESRISIRWTDNIVQPTTRKQIGSENYSG